MNVIKFICAILGKGKQINRLNFDCRYQTQAYENAVQFANQNIGIAGVRECLEKLKGDYREYNKQRESLKNQEVQNEISKYDSWERVYKLKFMIKWVVIVDFFFPKPGISYDSFILMGLGILFNFIFVFGIVAFIVLKIMEWRRRGLYQTYAKDMNRKIEDINYIYLQKTDKLKLEIDNLYLSSLDPMQKQLVLMQRAQERQHQEMVRMQQAYQQEHEKLLREQERTRQAQERLLAIEEERERRYNR